MKARRIREVRSGIPPEAAEKIIDASGMYVIPGGIDAHTHLDMPFGGTTSADDFETGTRAAAFGGTTSIVDFAIQARGTKMRDALDTWWKKAEGRAVIDYGLHMIVTDLGTSRPGRHGRNGGRRRGQFQAVHGLSQRPDGGRRHHLQGALAHRQERRADLHARRKRQRDRRDRAKALAEGKTAPIYHALTRPTRAEAEAVHRAIAMAEIAGVPVYIVHLSSEDALNEVREARDRGVPAFAETCPQYLLLSIEELERPNFEGAKYVFTPPLRTKENLPKLWDGLKHDHLQVVSTDHCPFCFEDQKILGKDDFTKIPNGGPGIENRMQLIYHYGVNAGKLSLNRFVEITSTTPARIFGMYPRKGEIAAGQRRRHRHLGSASAVHHQREDASHARGLFDVRGLPGAGQRPHGDLARAK